MSDAREEIELHPAAPECITRLHADLAASEARYAALRGAVREYLAARDELEQMRNWSLRGLARRRAEKLAIEAVKATRTRLATLSDSAIEAARSALDALTKQSDGGDRG